MRDDNELLLNVPRCTASILARLDKIDGALPMEGGSDTANAGSGGPTKTSGVATFDR